MDAVKVSKRLRELRAGYNVNGKQLSTKKLAEMLNEKCKEKGIKGITEQTLKDYERPGHHDTTDNITKGKAVLGMRIEYLDMLADFYGVTTDYVLARTETKTTKEDIAVAMQTTGLSEDSVKQLSHQQVWGIKDTAETIDFLLFDNARCYPGHGFRSVLDLLHFFLSYDDKQAVQKQVFTNGAFADIARNAKTISTNAIRINRRVIENAVLDEIQQALISIKKKRLESLEEGKHNGKY